MKYLYVNIVVLSAATWRRENTLVIDRTPERRRPGVDIGVKIIQGAANDHTPAETQAIEQSDADSLITCFRQWPIQSSETERAD